MRSKTRLAVAGTALAVSALVLQGSALASPAGGGSQAGGASAHDDTRSMQFHVVFSPFNYTDLGATGPSAADVIVFHDQLQQNGRKVGDEVGSCVLVEANGLSNCTGVIRLAGRGTIAFAFVNSPPPHKTLAITGGSGQFRTAQGDGSLQESTGGTGTLVLRIKD